MPHGPKTTKTATLSTIPQQSVTTPTSTKFARQSVDINISGTPIIQTFGGASRNVPISVAKTSRNIAGSLGNGPRVAASKCRLLRRATNGV